METETQAPKSRLTGRDKLIGTIVAAYAIFDFDDPVWLAAIFLNPLFVFVGAVALVLAFNLWACRWIDRAWDAWIAGERGQKIEPRCGRAGS
jgi:hypothetical protein